MKSKLVMAVVATLALTGLARAEGPDPIAIRQAGQDLVYGDFTGIRGVVAAHGDIAKLEQPAKAIARWMHVFPTEFPPGSDKGNTKALPVIWSDHAGFVQHADALAAAADKLAMAAKAGNRSGVIAGIRAMGNACRACHERYKAK